MAAASHHNNNHHESIIGCDVERGQVWIRGDSARGGSDTSSSRGGLTSKKRKISKDGNNSATNSSLSSTSHTFSFHHIFREDSSQSFIYKKIGLPLLKHALEGYNVTVFAYGQTSSGKTFTMMGERKGKGDQHDEVSRKSRRKHYDAPNGAASVDSSLSSLSPSAPSSTSQEGLIPRICGNLFDMLHQKVHESHQKSPSRSLKFTVETSMLEIYNEKIRDLLNPASEGNKMGLKVREHPSIGPIVLDLSTNVVNSSHEIRTLLKEGASYRAIAKTNMNDSSSRSHTIVQIVLTQTKLYRNELTGEMEGSDTVSKINLVDLAGSERSSKSTQSLNASTRTQRLQEGNAINLSLTTLGVCITNLAKISTQKKSKKKKEIFVPYRNSKLTWLLKDSLGGNSRCVMVACISSLAYNYQETLSTLRYAHQAKQIKNKARVNRDPNVTIIFQLKSEIAQLKELLKKQGIGEGMNGRIRNGQADSGSNAETSKHSEEIGSTSHSQVFLDKDASNIRQHSAEDAQSIKTKSTEPRSTSTPGQTEKLLRELAESQRIIKELQMSEKEKKQRTKQIQESRQKVLAATGITVKLLSDTFGFSTRLTPHFLNLNEDPSMNECLLYFFREGETEVGSSPQNDVVLKGVDILPHHCKIRRHYITHGEEPDKPISLVYIIPHISGGKTSAIYVNGETISYETELKHLDRVIFGTNHVFRFNNPGNSHAKDATPHSSERQLFDWKYAQEELKRQHMRQYKKEMKLLEEEVQRQKKDAQTKLDSELRALEERQIEQLKRNDEEKNQQNEKPAALLPQGGPVSTFQAPQTPTTPTTPVSRRKSIAHQLFQRKKHLSHETTHQQVRKMQSGIMEILPSIKEANSMAEQMSKNVKYVLKVHLAHNGIPECGVQVVNSFANTVSTWTANEFQNKLFQMRELFFLWGESNDSGMPPYSDDPFYSSNRLHIGRCSVPLSSITRGKSTNLSLIVQDALGAKQATLDVGIELLSDNMLSVEDLHGQSLSFVIHIKRLHSTIKKYVREAFVEYQFFDDEPKQTSRITGDDILFGFEMEYNIPCISREILEYLERDNLEFTIRGELFDQFVRGSKPERATDNISVLDYETGSLHADGASQDSDNLSAPSEAMKQLALENESLKQQLLEIKRREQLQKQQMSDLNSPSPERRHTSSSLGEYKSLVLRCFEAFLPTKGHYYAKLIFNDQKHKTIVSRPKSCQAHWSEKFVLHLSEAVDAYDTIEIRIMKKNAIMRNACMASIMIPLFRMQELSSSRDGSEWLELKSSGDRGDDVVKMRLGARFCF